MAEATLGSASEGTERTDVDIELFRLPLPDDEGNRRFFCQMVNDALGYEHHVLRQSGFDCVLSDTGQFRLVRTAFPAEKDNRRCLMFAIQSMMSLLRKIKIDTRVLDEQHKNIEDFDVAEKEVRRRLNETIGKNRWFITRWLNKLYPTKYVYKPHEIDTAEWELSLPETVKREDAFFLAFKAFLEKHAAEIIRAIEVQAETPEEKVNPVVLTISGGDTEHKTLQRKGINVYLEINDGRLVVRWMTATQRMPGVQLGTMSVLMMEPGTSDRGFGPLEGLVLDFSRSEEFVLRHANAPPPSPRPDGATLG
jgi:hypothetical protein